jgi:hypothetical protein
MKMTDNVNLDDLDLEAEEEKAERDLAAVTPEEQEEALWAGYRELLKMTVPPPRDRAGRRRLH